MKWTKASEKMPVVENRAAVNIKYKGRAAVIVFYHGEWYWSDNSYSETHLHPVEKDSWSAIEYLDETVQASPDGANLSKIKDAVTRAINELPEGDDYDPGQVVMDARDSLYKILSLTKKTATHPPDAKPLIEALENLNKELDSFWNTKGSTKLPIPDSVIKKINASQKKASEALKNYNK